MRYKFLLFTLFLIPQLAWAAILPEANVQVNPSKGDLKTKFVLDASLSQNVNGLKTGLQFRFKASNDGHFSSWGSTPKFYFWPYETGTFQAEVQVRDRFGNENRTYVSYRVIGESFRKIRLVASENNSKRAEAVELKVIISSSRAQDKDESQVRWDFTSDGYFDTDYSMSKAVYHVYNGAFTQGQTTPTAEVRFPDGEIKRVRGFEVVGESFRSRTSVLDQPKIVLNSFAPRNPVVTVTPGPEAFSESSIFVFDASKTQTNGWLEWSIDGIKSFGNEKKIQHKFLSPGKHQIRVRNCVNEAQPDCAETTLEVNIKPDPTDVILNFLMFNLTDRSRSSSQSGFLTITSGDRVRFSSQILRNFNRNQKWQCRWDFDGDGFWDTPFSGSVSAEHTYDKPGSYGVRLQIRALRSSDKIDKITKTKTLIVRENKSPKGKIWLQKMTNYAREQVFFQAILGDRNSEDNLEIRVDSDGDGAWDTDFRKIKSWWWEYEEPGRYEVTMQVRDPQKKVYQTKRFIDILPVPLAAIKVKVSNRQQIAGKSINFDASETFGEDLHYEWKIVGNPYVWAQGNRANLTFLKPGNHTVCLRVIDQLGREQSIDIPVQILAESEVEIENVKGEIAPKVSADTKNNLNFMGLKVPEGIDLSQPEDPFAVSGGYIPRPERVVTGMRAGP